MKMFFTLYKTTNKINGKIYIGVHQTDDPNDDYLGSGELLLKAVEKYGRDSFDKEILSLHESSEEMFKEEFKIVNKDFVARGDTYNLNLGGEGGWGFSEESQEKGRKTLWNRFENDTIFRKEYSKKQSENAYRTGFNKLWSGRKHKKETIEKQKEILKEKKHQQGAKNSQYGTCWMYSLEEQKNIKVKKEEVDKYLSMGYTKGRKMKF